MGIKKLKDYPKRPIGTRAAQAQQGFLIRDLISQFENGNAAPLMDYIKQNADLQTLVRLYDEGGSLDRADLKETLQSPLTKHFKEKPEDAYKVKGIGAYDLVKETKRIYAGALIEKYKQGDKQPLLDTVKNNSEFLFDVASVNNGINQEIALAAIANKNISVSSLPTEYFNNSDFLAEALKIDKGLYARMAGSCARNLIEDYIKERNNLIQQWYSPDISNERKIEINARLQELKKYLDSGDTLDKIKDDRKYLESKDFPKAWTTDGSLLLRIMVHTPRAVLDASDELFTNPKFIDRAINLCKLNNNVYRSVINRFAMLPEGEQKESTKLVLREHLISFAKENEDFLVNMDADTVEALGLTEQRKQLEQKDQSMQNADETAKQPKEPQQISPEEQAKQNMDQRMQGIRPERVAQNANLQNMQPEGLAQQEQEAKNRMDQRMQGIKPEREPRNIDDLRKARIEENKQALLALGRKKLREERIAREQEANKQQEQPAPQQEEEVRAKKASKNVILNFFKKVSVTFQDVTSKVLGRLKQDKKAKEQAKAEPEITIEKLEELRKTYNDSLMKVDVSKMDTSKFADQDWLLENASNPEIWRAAVAAIGQTKSLLGDLKAANIVAELNGGKNPIVAATQPKEDDIFNLDADFYYDRQQKILNSPFILEEIKEAINQGKNITEDQRKANQDYIKSLSAKLCSDSVLESVQGELLTGYNANIESVLMGTMLSLNGGSGKLAALMAKSREFHNISTALENQIREYEEKFRQAEQEKLDAELKQNSDLENADNLETESQQPEQAEEQPEPKQTEVEQDNPQQIEQAEPQNVQPAEVHAEPEQQQVEAKQPKQQSVEPSQPAVGQPAPKRNFRDILARLGKPKTNESTAPAQQQPKQQKSDVQESQAEAQNVQPAEQVVNPKQPQQHAEPILQNPSRQPETPVQPQLSEAEQFIFTVNKDVIKGTFSQEVVTKIAENPDLLNSFPDYIKNDTTLMRQAILANPECRKYASDRVQGLVDAKGNLVEEQKKEQAAAKEQQFEDMLKNTSVNNIDSKYWSDPEFVEWFALNKLTSQSVLDAFIEKFDVDLLENDEFRTKLIKIVNKKEKDIIARNKVGQQLIDQVKNVTNVSKEQIEQEKKRLAQEYNANTQVNLSYNVEDMGLPDEFLDNMSR